MSSLIPSVLELLPEAAGSFAAGLLEAVLNGMWQGALLTGLVAVVLKVIRRPNAATRFVVWWACLLMVVLLPAISYGWRLGAGWLGERGASEATLIGSAPAFLLPGGFWPVVIALTWAGVSTYLLLRLGAAYAAMQRLKRRSEPLSEDDDAIGLLVDSHPSLPRVVLRRSDGISSPITAGLARPMILLPNQVLESLSRAELRHVVLHELTHVERNDDRIVLVQRILEALFFFHPAVFWIGRRLDLEREIACDHRVAALTGEAKEYARCLTRLAELQPASRRSLLASGALLSRRHLVRRVRILLEDSRQRGRDLVSRRIALGGTVGCLAVVAWFATLTPVLEIPAPRTSDGMLARTPASPVVPTPVPVGSDSSTSGLLPAGAADIGHGQAVSSSKTPASASSLRDAHTGGSDTPQGAGSAPAAGLESGTADASSYTDAIAEAPGAAASESRARDDSHGAARGPRRTGENVDSRLEFGSGPGPSMPPSALEPPATTRRSPGLSRKGVSDEALETAEYRVGQRIDVVSDMPERVSGVADGLHADPHHHHPGAHRPHHGDHDRDPHVDRPERRDADREAHDPRDRRHHDSRDDRPDRDDCDRDRGQDSNGEECVEENLSVPDASEEDWRDRDSGGPLR